MDKSTVARFYGPRCMPWQLCPSVCLSVTGVNQSKTLQAKITKFSLSAVQKSLVLKPVKLFHKFKRGDEK